MRFLAATACLLFITHSANADVIWTITGADTDTVVNWEISGSVTVNNNFASTSSQFVRFPTVSGGGIMDATVGLGTGGITGSAFSRPWTGDFAISVNGGSDLFTDTPTTANIVDSGSGDQIQFRQAGSQSLPFLNVNDVITYSGSGTIDLGVAKNTLLVNGSYVGEALQSDTDTLTLVVQDTPAGVPEPSTWALLTLAGVGFGGYQLRKRGKVKQS